MPVPRPAAPSRPNTILLWCLVGQFSFFSLVFIIYQNTTRILGSCYNPSNSSLLLFFISNTATKTTRREVDTPSRIFQFYRIGTSMVWSKNNIPLAFLNTTTFILKRSTLSRLCNSKSGNLRVEGIHFVEEEAEKNYQ